MTFSLPDGSAELPGSSHDPDHTTPAGLTCDRFSLIRFRSPLLTESRLFSLPAGTEMFHFPTFPPHALCVQARVTPHDWCGVPPFGNPRINARLTAPRGLSQPPTSFIGSWCPGIHRVPLTTWPHKKPHTPTPGRRRLCGPTRTLPPTKSQKDARVHCAVLNVQPDTPHTPPPNPRTPRGTRRYEKQGGPEQKQRPPGQTPGPVPSGPNSVPTTNPPSTTPFHTPPRERRTGSRPQPAA